jgi:hypothetical protein
VVGFEDPRCLLAAVDHSDAAGIALLGGAARLALDRWAPTYAVPGKKPVQVEWLTPARVRRGFRNIRAKTLSNRCAETVPTMPWKKGAMPRRTG